MKKLILILTIIFCFNTAHSQFYPYQQSKPKIDTIIVDTITNIEAASKFLILSGEDPNQAIIDILVVTGIGTGLSITILFSDAALIFPILFVPVSIGFGINYWVQTYKGNVYLQKAGRYLSNKGENSIEKIDGKYYYIKYISK